MRSVLVSSLLIIATAASVTIGAEAGGSAGGGAVQPGSTGTAPGQPGARPSGGNELPPQGPAPRTGDATSGIPTPPTVPASPTPGAPAPTTGDATSGVPTPPTVPETGSRPGATPGRMPTGDGTSGNPVPPTVPDTTAPGSSVPQPPTVVPPGAGGGNARRDGLMRDNVPAINTLDPITGVAVDPSLGTFAYVLPGVNGGTPLAIRLGFSSAQSLQAFQSADAATRLRYAQAAQQAQQNQWEKTHQPLPAR